MTQTEAFEANLSRSSDSTVLRGKSFAVLAGVTAVTLALALTPTATLMGGRANALATVFSRYRFKDVRMKILSGGSGSGFAVVGVIDDTTVVTGDFPTTASGVSELRCSATSFVGQTVPTQFEWSPVDKNLWYYCDPETSGDSRLVNSGSIVYSSTSTAPVSIEIDYTLVFKGATDLSSQ